MRPCAIFLSVVMFLNMMDLGVFAETVQKVMDESNNPYYIADEDKIYDEGNTAQKSRRDTARSDIIRPWINR